MHSSSPTPYDPNSVTLTDSKAKAIPIFSGLWVAIVLAGTALLVAGSFFWSMAFLLVGGGSAFWLIPNALAFFKWHPAELVIPANAFTLGATQTVTYRRRPRKISDIAETQVQLTLECVETARYRVGTDTRTETATVFQQAFHSSGRGTPNGFEAPIPVHVPSNVGGPTLQLSNNRVEWRMKVQPDPAGKLPTQNATFPLVVGPVLAKPEIQDAPPPNRDTPQDGDRY